MAQDHTFDIVSKVNLQEVRNAALMAQKEIATRFDFRGSSAGVAWDEATLTCALTADQDLQLRNVLQLLREKLAKRGVSLKALSEGPIEQTPAGKFKQTATLQEGIVQDKAKAIVQAIKGLGLKVQPRIEGDTVRVVGKQIDDLQTVIQHLRARDFGVALQVENYR
ncbi:MAG: YajQ family cyclic di-GMP-binding protein [Candidatus Omnitrophica bacterium]|nr:YajQ family cyclic di-GMP-binding protein [Candidatus Omnitrophota bacterium]